MRYSNENMYSKGERVYKAPSQKEAISATRELHGLAHEIAEFILPYTEAVIMFGSAAYGANYSVSNDSDIDLEVVVENIPKELLELPFIRQQEKSIEELVEPFFDLPVPVMLYKFVYKNKEASFNFVKKKEFEKLMSVDLINTQDKLGFVELRNYVKESLLYKNRRNFQGDSIEWASSNTEVGKNLYLTDLPFYQIPNFLYPMPEFRCQLLVRTIQLHQILFLYPDKNQD